MDLTSLQIEGISRSSFNLDNYDFSTKQVSQIFKHGETPSSKRKLATTQRWDFLNKKCEEFHNLEHPFQIDSLINFLSQCASRIPEPTEESETDPQDNEKDISDE